MEIYECNWNAGGKAMTLWMKNWDVRHAQAGLVEIRLTRWNRFLNILCDIHILCTHLPHIFCPNQRGTWKPCRFSSYYCYEIFFISSESVSMLAYIRFMQWIRYGIHNLSFVGVVKVFYFCKFGWKNSKLFQKAINLMWRICNFF